METKQEEQQPKKKSWLTTNKVILMVAIGILGFFLYLRGCDSKNYSKNEGVNLINALQDSLRTYKNKDSINVATITVLETQNINTFLDVKSKDTQVNKLQAVVEDYKKKLKAGNSVTTALIETLAIEKGKTKGIVFKDTSIYIPVYNRVYPEYRDTLDNGWISYTQRMNQDSSYLNLRVRNSFSAVVGTEKGGLFNRGRPFVDLTLDNPYSEVKELRTYQVALPSPKKIGIGLQTGVTVGAGLKVKPYIGVGVSYNIIRF